MPTTLNQPVRVRLGRRQGLLMRVLGLLLVLAVVVAVVGGLFFTYEYHQYQGVVDQRLAQGPLFSSNAQIYAAPKEVRPGQRLTAQTIAAELRKAGYSDDGQAAPLGSYQLQGESRR